MLPRLGDNRRRFEQHTEDPEGRVDLHGVLGFDPPTLGHEPVDLLDPALGVPAVPAHVPLPHRTIGAGHGVGAADDADHEITLLEGAGRTRIDDAAEGFVAEHEASRARGAQPYLPSTISTSVPHTPTATASTRIEPSCTSGSGKSS